MVPPDRQNGDVEGTIGNRLWRVERRQEDVIKRLDKDEERLEAMRHVQDERAWKIDALEKAVNHSGVDERLDALRARIEALEKKPEPSSLFGEGKVVQIVVWGLLAAVVALATGQFINLAILQ